MTKRQATPFRLHVTYIVSGNLLICYIEHIAYLVPRKVENLLTATY